MIRQTRLGALNGVGVSKKRRLKPAKYFLGVTLVAPDQAYIDLYKNGIHVETIAEITPVDVRDEDLDSMGRLKPSAIWDMLKVYSKYVLETKGVTPELPDKHQVFQGDYMHLSVHPRLDM